MTFLVRRGSVSLGIVAVLLATSTLADGLREAKNATAKREFRAGAFAMDVTPEKLPVLVNGGMYSRSADKVVDPLHARCLVLDDGTAQIAIVVVDSCMIPRSLLDEAKQLASKATGIPTSRMLISATHTHSAPSVFGCLGTDQDEAYARFLPPRIARGIQLAQKNLEPARIGWGVAKEPKNVFCRRWRMKPATALTNPFGGTKDDRAQMNPGHNNANKIERTGVADDDVSIVSIQSRGGRPIAILANYSTHYAGAPALSADYFAVFANKIAKLIDAENATPPFVGIMSNGTSGDANCYDFTRGSRRQFDRFTVAEDTAQAALKAYRQINYFDWVPLVMQEELLTLNVRMPGDEEVARAREFLKTDEGRRLRSIPAVYARETILLSELPPTRELKLQAIRLGELGITAIPNEVYGSTGLEIKKHSPLKTTFTIELANGCEGYIPPPDQHKLGGYTTWRARTSCLEVEAEPKIRAKVLELLQKVAAQRTDEKPVLAQQTSKDNPPVRSGGLVRSKPNKLGAKSMLRAGAYAIDITPTKFPVVVNGMFTERTAGGAHDKLHARCLVLENQGERLAIVVVDNLMMPRELLDEAKKLASGPTGIPVSKMLISATHTHSAPAVMGCLGSGTDPQYGPFLVKQIVRGIQLACQRTAPAQAGWAVVDAPNQTHCRRWILRPDRIGGDPFGQRTVRAMMHPGYQSANHVGPAGPVDSGLSVLSIQSQSGQPIAVLANYSMHYFGSPLVSADYFGRFCEMMEKDITGKDQQNPPVVIMSQGTSGDLHWMDYSRPQIRISLDQYARDVADVALKAYRSIQYTDDVPLAMAQAKLKLGRRVPDENRLAWAREIAKGLGDRKPQSRPEIYALEQIFLHDEPQRELLLQAVRIGELGITAIPNEVYGITGLKLKLQSPLTPTFNVELANGAEGYIPPPEQHKLGGYTAWPARTAGLEEQAEPKIVETLLTLLEKVAGQKRRPLPAAHGEYAKAVLGSKPAAYWRLEEIAGHSAADAAGNENTARFEDGIALYLTGPASARFNGPQQINRAPHLAGGRVAATLDGLKDTYSVEMWFNNRLPNNARPVTAYLFSRGNDDTSKEAPGDHLGIMGTFENGRQGRLFFFNGNKLNEVLVGKSVIEPGTWNHVVLVRDGKRVRAYLNGNSEAEIDGEADVSIAPSVKQLFLGGRNDNFANLAGLIDEVAVYDRALTADEIRGHFQAAGVQTASRERKLSETARNHGNDVQQNQEHNQGADAPRSPVSPEESLKYLHVRPGMKIELVAAEPLIRDPVAFDWGPDGKLWVVEYLDYPTGIDGKGTGGGRVVFLEDADGDGRYDKSTVFIENLNFPNGVMAWRGGVLITAAPDILYAEDTNGDGKADVKNVLYTGFHEANQQLRVNGLRWGLDNWIYCASGSHHGGYGAESRIKSTKTGQLVHVGSRDFRIRPDESLIDPQSGPTQFGRNRDAWGNWFGCQNAKPMWHYVLADHYLRRNPYVAPPPSQVLLSDVPGQRPVFPRSRPGKFHHASQAGRFTSANSAMIYGDELLGEKFIGNSFVSEPVHNLVHREIVERSGVTFKSHKPKDEENTEFLASEDTWFRPTTIRTGPDGALWVADMYREIIEHPRWVSDNLKPLVDTRSGNDRGRIYRIYPAGAKPRDVPRIDKLDTNQLVALLESPSATLRDMVQVQIVTRKLDDAAGPLEKLALGSKRPETRLQALCTLDGLAALSDAALAKAVKDENPWVVRQALRLCEPARGSNFVIGIKSDDPVVRLQLAYLLGSMPAEQAARPLADMALKSGDDAFALAAVMSSLNENNLSAFIASLFDAKRQPADSPGSALIAATIDTAVGLKNRAVIAQIATFATRDPANELAALVSLRRALSRHKIKLEDIGDNRGEIFARVEKACEVARQAIAKSDGATDPNWLSDALKLLGSAPQPAESDLRLIASQLVPQARGQIQAAAVDALAESGSALVPRLLLADWKSHGPQLRSGILEALLSRGPWTEALLVSIEQGNVSAADIDAARRQRLLKSGNPAIRAKAAKLLSGGADADRAKVVAQYQPVLASLASGDTVRGKEVFAKRCSACHKLEELGKQVGPDLKGLTDKSPQNLLTSILDPNRALEPKFVSYTAVTTAGRIYSGMLANESGGSLSLLDAEGRQHTILRRDLDELSASGKSLMPEGLEKDITPQQMADLLKYLNEMLKN